MEINPVVALIAVIIIALVMFFFPRNQLKVLFTLCLLALIFYFLIITVIEMPPFGHEANPANNEIPARYLDKAVEDTGIPNAVSSIILDYRAMDTLGEATVIFIAIAAVIATIKAHAAR